MAPHRRGRRQLQSCPQARGAASAQPSEVVNCIKSLLRNKLLICSLVFSYCSVH